MASETEFLRPFCGADACFPRKGGLPGESSHQAGKRLLAEILGLREATGRWSDPAKREPVAFRGEVVSVLFDPARPSVPAVVISPDDYNSQRLNAVVVLQCIAFDARHARLHSVLPLGQGGELSGITEKWSVDLTRVRGISCASTVLRKYSPPVRLDQHDPDRYAELLARLEDLYV